MSKSTSKMTNDVLKKCIGRKVKDIYVTGYSELRNNFNFFSPMNWWYYIEFDNSFVCIESVETNEVLRFYTQSEIKCNFEIEDENIFTIMSVQKDTYSKIISFELFYDKADSNIYGMGILFDNNKYIFFNSLNFNGIHIEDASEKESFLSDNRFRMETIA